MRALLVSALAVFVAGCGTDTFGLIDDCTEAWWFGSFGYDFPKGQYLDNECPKIPLNDVLFQVGQTYTRDLSGWPVDASPDLAVQGAGLGTEAVYKVDGVVPAKAYLVPWITSEPSTLVTVLQWDPPLQSPKTLTIEPGGVAGGSLFLVFVNEACEAAHPVPACGAP